MTPEQLCRGDGNHMKTLSLYRSIAERYHHLRHIRTVAMMTAISHQIERQVLKHHMPIDFYAGFQRFSAFPQQRQRYEHLGAVCQRVYIFGIADVQPPSIPGTKDVFVQAASAHSLMIIKRRAKALRHYLKVAR